MWCLPASATNLFSLRKLHSSERKFCLKINFTVEGKTAYHIFSKIAHTWWVLWQFASLPVPDALLLKLGNFVHKGKCLRSFLEHLAISTAALIISLKSNDRIACWVLRFSCILQLWAALYVFLCCLICPSNQSHYSALWWLNFFWRNDIPSPKTRLKFLGFSNI